jgi:hypothetical protein
MSFSTSLLGPWDDISTAHKQLVSVAVPPEVKERLFTVFLPRRGNVDKLIARLIYLVDAYLVNNPHLGEFDANTREEIVNNLLNTFVDHLQNLDPKTIIPQ